MTAIDVSLLVTLFLGVAVSFLSKPFAASLLIAAWLFCLFSAARQAWQGRIKTGLIGRLLVFAVMFLAVIYLMGFPIFPILNVLFGATVLVIALWVVAARRGAR